MSKVQTRTRDIARTRLAILHAAQHVFSMQAYSEASLRDITTRAGVNTSLVSRYFGSKEGLFREALSEALAHFHFTDIPKNEFGSMMAHRFTTAFEDTVNPLHMLVLSASNEGARLVALEILQSHVTNPIAEWLGGQNRDARAAQIMALATGFFTYRLLLPLPPMQGEIDPNVKAWLAKSIQDIVDQ